MSTATVGWDVDATIDWIDFPPLDGDVTADACVIGLGGSGLAAIGDLLGRGCSVIGIDAGRIAGRAAGRNGGFLLGGPAQAIHDFADIYGTDTAVAFYRQTLDEIAHLETLLGDEIIRRVGSLRIAGLPGAPDSAELADCEKQYEFMTAQHLPVQRYSGQFGDGLYFPMDAAMNPVRRAMSLARLYGGRARLHENTPAVTVAAGRVDTPTGVISARTIIVAVDGRLEVLLPQLADRVRTTRLQMAATAPVALTVPCPLYANYGFDYLQQDDTGRIMAGGGRDRFLDGEWTTDDQPTDAVQEWITTLIDRVAPGSPVTHRWAASVGYTEDYRPLVTAVDDGVVACGGYCGTGNLVGPIAARAAIALAMDGASPPEYFAT